MDDREAVENARHYGLTVTGILGVLDRDATRGLIDLPGVIAQLQATNFRASPELLQTLQEGLCATKAGEITALRAYVWPKIIAVVWSSCRAGAGAGRPRSIYLRTAAERAREPPDGAPAIRPSLHTPNGWMRRTRRTQRVDSPQAGLLSEHGRGGTATRKAVIPAPHPILALPRLPRRWFRYGRR